MTKAISLILGAAMIVQLIRPLGLPGLKKRADAWKLAVFALALVAVVAAIK
ncbi:MAG TPA: hypothetical protein VHG92_03810 [Afifellaceae bacterium]|nr:hypothetical protein [Afifellaceae bacterium]